MVQYKAALIKITFFHSKRTLLGQLYVTCSLDLFPWTGSTTASTFFTSVGASGFIIAAAAASSSSCLVYFQYILQKDPSSCLLSIKKCTPLLLQHLRLHPLHLLHLPLPCLLVCSHLGKGVLEKSFSFWTNFGLK